MMTPEELLMPRYKAIADYPGNTRPIGFVFQMEKKDPEGWYTTTGYLQEKFFTMYPHLFQPLEWWEDRKPEDMPGYVKCINTPDQKIMPGQSFKVKWCIPGAGRAATGQWIVADTNCYIPITEQEYLEYFKQKEEQQ